MDMNTEQIAGLINDVLTWFNLNKNLKQKQIIEHNTTIINLITNLKKTMPNTQQLHLFADMKTMVFDVMLINKQIRDKQSNALQSISLQLPRIHQIKLENIQQNKLTSCNFNILHYFSISETKHSYLLAMLLSPTKHGQNSLFLIEFLKELKIDSPEKGNWTITAEEGRIDVLIKRIEPLSIIIIENKSNWAIDQPNQLYRYWYQEIFLKTKETARDYYERNKNQFKIIYCSPNEYKNPNPQSLQKPSSWKDLPETVPMEIELQPFNIFISSWLKRCIEIIPESNHRMREFLQQYNEICQAL